MAPRSGDGVGEGVREARSRRKVGTTKGENQAEALLWLELKRRKLGGYKFTRQYPIGPYYADFCCREAWLVVEIDGSQHADCAYDRRRDEFMRQRGYSTIRCPETSHLRLRNRPRRLRWAAHRRRHGSGLAVRLRSKLDWSGIAQPSSGLELNAGRMS